MSSRRALFLFMFAVALYFLVVNGPIGYARYRLPIEPTFIVLFVAGLAALGLLDWIEGAVKRLRPTQKDSLDDARLLGHTYLR